MVVVSEDLVRKHAEHNDCQISTLEELSLHQCDIERIENIDRWCHGLKILYLQGNLIPKIENLSRLKQLEYLNLALNNIQRIEGLHGCESLKKLDLTANFIAELTSVASLKCNTFLVTLYLTGNPCTEFIGYRDFVVATIPQLRQLDGVDIDRSEQILALQNYERVRCDIMRQEKLRLKVDGCHSDFKKSQQNKKGSEAKAVSEGDSFWQEISEYTPESRIQMHKYLESQKQRSHSCGTSTVNELSDAKPVVRYFNDAGKPLNINQAKVEFAFNDDDEAGEYQLEVCCYKHLDTSLIQVDLQPTYVRVFIKGKVLQIVLPSEVSPDRSTAHRSVTTGYLVVKMPKSTGPCMKKALTQKKIFSSSPLAAKVKSVSNNAALEVDPRSISMPNISEIFQEPKLQVNHLVLKQEVHKKTLDVVAPSSFVDNLEVPPLM